MLSADQVLNQVFDDNNNRLSVATTEAAYDFKIVSYDTAPLAQADLATQAADGWRPLSITNFLTAASDEALVVLYRKAL